MQCLYCETELKPLRGLFDEDFCCKEHREKYFSSFRKGINLLPVLDLPPLTSTQETSSAQAEPEAIEEQLHPVAVTRHAEVEEEAAEEPGILPEPAIAMLAEELPKAEPVREISSPVIAIASPIVEKPVMAAVSVEAVREEAEEEAAEQVEATPLAADFLHLHIAPTGAEDCYFMVEENSFSACNGPAIPDVEVFCDAALDPEECLAHLVIPMDMAAAASGRAATPEPPPAIALASSFGSWDYARSVTALLPADLIEDVEMFVAGAVTRDMVRCVESQPLAFAAAPVSAPWFETSIAESAEPEVAAAARFEITCAQIENSALMFSDMEAALEIHSPAFQVSAAAMQLDEELKRAIEPPKKEAARLAEPEIARPAAMSAAPASHAVSASSFQPAMPAARPEAQLNVPAMSSTKTDAAPGVASEAVPDPPRGAAAEQAPSAHSPEPVQPAIQSSVRIKNWRLKITFAKPA